MTSVIFSLYSGSSPPPKPNRVKLEGRNQRHSIWHPILHLTATAFFQNSNPFRLGAAFSAPPSHLCKTEIFRFSSTAEIAFLSPIKSKVRFPWFDYKNPKTISLTIIILSDIERQDENPWLFSLCLPNSQSLNTRTFLFITPLSNMFHWGHNLYASHNAGVFTDK